MVLYVVSYLKDHRFCCSVLFSRPVHNSWHFFALTFCIDLERKIIYGPRFKGKEGLYFGVKKYLSPPFRKLYFPLCPFYLNSSLLHLFYPYTFHFLVFFPFCLVFFPILCFFFPLSSFFFSLTSFFFYIFPLVLFPFHIFSPK